MSNRTTLKGYFVTNAIPKQSDFADLIDSAFVQTEDSIRKQGSDPVAIQAQQADQNGIQQVLHFYKNFNDANAAWKLSLLTQNTTNPTNGLSIGNTPTGQSSFFIKESDGSIGIGTTNPGAKLDVNGMGWFRNNPGGGLPATAGKGIKITTENNTGNIFSYDYTSSNPLNLVLQGAGGNVGITNTTPRGKLDVGILSKGQLGSVFARIGEGDTSGEGTFLGVRVYKTQPENPGVPEDIKSFAIEHSFYGRVNSAINFFRGFNELGGFLTFCTNENTERVRIDPSGNVGIGTSSPGAKLHVAGFVSGNIANYRWFAKSPSGQWGDTSASGAPISIMASDRVVASEFNATSDLRIKKDLIINDSQQSLETINRMQVKNFRYKDEVQHGSALHQGVIAQELEAIFPEAVTKHTDFVPDIYSLPQSTSVSNNILTVTVENPHYLVTGDTIRLITASSSKDVQVVRTSDTDFFVDNWQEESTDIFVYGKQVNDCRTVNYNSIFCLGISAIQALYKQLRQLKREIEEIKERMPATFISAM